MDYKVELYNSFIADKENLKYLVNESLEKLEQIVYISEMIQDQRKVSDKNKYKIWKSIKTIERNCLIRELQIDLLPEMGNTIRNLFHILGVQLFKFNEHSNHNEYYRLEDLNTRLTLYKINAENYTKTRVIRITVDILKQLEVVYPEMFE